MYKTYVLTIVLLLSRFFVAAQDEKEILKLLDDQTIAWNNGDLDGFMKGYWNNDSLMFVGKKGVVYGYRNTFKRYKETYYNQDQMGKLAFVYMRVKKLSDEYYMVLGQFMLKRKAGDLEGHYTLLFQKINGKWLIISDHSS